MRSLVQSLNYRLKDDGTVIRRRAQFGRRTLPHALSRCRRTANSVAILLIIRCTVLWANSPRLINIRLP